MNKAARALILYLVSLLAFSLLLNLFNIKVIELPFSVNGKENVKIQPMMLLIIAAKIGLVTIMGRNFRFDLIIFNYYENVSRIATPLPFILYWFINYLLFDKKQSDTSVEKESEPSV